MTREEFNNKIQEEMNQFRKDTLARGAVYVFDDAYRITVMQTFHDYFLYDNGDLGIDDKDGFWNFGEDDLGFLDEECRGHVLSVLSDEYFDDEYCDIARNQDIKQLIENCIYRWRNALNGNKPFR